MNLSSSGESDAGPDAAESVSAFTRRVKSLLEGQMKPCWVRGEVSNLRSQPSGHVYFSLKDAGAQVSAVLFRGNALKQSVKLRDGLQVVLFGEVGVYELRGQYQLVVRIVVEDGVGRLRREFEALKARLEAEGLFDRERKRPMPPMPAAVGFVTSPTGAALQDFLRILRRRDWRGRLVVLPARVQGEGAAAEMIEMLTLSQEVLDLDLLVIGRGGGSVEDLWAFNEEALVRAVAAARIPVVSAVGHEIDFTLCDFAADVRAETPSAAAELISSNYVDSRERSVRAGKLLGERAAGTLRIASEQVSHARSRLRLLSPSGQVREGWQRVDDSRNRLTDALRSSLESRRTDLQEVRSRFALRDPQARIELASHQLLGLWKRLQAASPESVLNRGFAIVRDENGKPVTRRKAVRKGQQLTTEFADGALPVRAE
jgi:exodeoxyribonuclease VII large subunit